MVLAMLRCYVRDHRRDWDEYVQVLTYACSTGVHSSTRETPFEMVVSRTPRDPSIYHYIEDPRIKAWKGKENWVMKRDSTVAPAKFKLKGDQVSYNKT